MFLDDFQQAFGAALESRDAETVGGVLLDAFGELPAVGATTTLSGLQFTVETIEHNRIMRVLVEHSAEVAIGTGDTPVADMPATAGPAKLVTDVPPKREEL